MSIATYSTKSSLNYIWYVYICLQLMCGFSVYNLGKNCSYSLTSSFKNWKMTFLVSVTKLLVSSPEQVYECLRKAVVAYIAEATRIDGEYTQKSMHCIVILMRQSDISDSFSSRIWHFSTNCQLTLSPANFKLWLICLLIFSIQVSWKS